MYLERFILRPPRSPIASARRPSSRPRADRPFASGRAQIREQLLGGIGRLASAALSPR